MKEALTEESLGIFFSGSEVDGISAYGYFDDQERPQDLIPIDFWPSTTVFKEFFLQGEGWFVVGKDIVVTEWPPAQEWSKLIRRTLQTFIRAGARVAWCGLEGHFADPPDLFNPDQMGSGVWAALTSTGSFYLKAQLGKRFAVLEDRVIAELGEAIYK